MLKSMILGIGAMVLGLALTGEASAQRFRPRPGFGPVRPHPANPYHLKHGVRFGNGYYYPGKNHNHWGRRVWDTRYNRYHYWDPYLKCNYYWCPRRSCYLPVDPCIGGGFPTVPRFPF